LTRTITKVCYFISLFLLFILILYLNRIDLSLGDGGSGRSHCQKTKGFTVTSSEEQRPQPSRDKTKATSSKKTVEAGKAIKVPCLKPGEVRRKERCSIPTLSNKGNHISMAHGLIVC